MVTLCQEEALHTEDMLGLGGPGTENRATSRACSVVKGMSGREWSRRVQQALPSIVELGNYQANAVTVGAQRQQLENG